MPGWLEVPTQGWAVVPMPSWVVVLVPVLLPQALIFISISTQSYADQTLIMLNKRKRLTTYLSAAQQRATTHQDKQVSIKGVLHIPH